MVLFLLLLNVPGVNIVLDRKSSTSLLCLIFLVLMEVCTAMQVHPCGQYRKNTIVGILQAEYGLAPFFRIHGFRYILDAELVDLCRDNSNGVF